MRFLILMMVVLIVGVACSSGQTDTVAEAVVDIGATVDAAVEATRVAERETWTPVPSATSLPTFTPVPTATTIPTPEPYVASPGSIELGIERLSACFRDSEVLGEIYVGLLASSGDVTLQEEEFVVALMGNEEFLKLSLSEGMGEGPEFAQMMAFLGSMGGEICSSDFEGVGVGSAGGVGYVDSEAKDFAGELSDCLQENDGFAEDFWSGADDTVASLFLEEMHSDRGLFVDLVSAATLVDKVEWSLTVAFEENCR